MDYRDLGKIAPKPAPRAIALRSGYAPTGRVRAYALTLDEWRAMSERKAAKRKTRKPATTKREQTVTVSERPETVRAGVIRMGEF